MTPVQVGLHYFFMVQENPDTRLREALDSSGARYTRQRAAVFAYLQSTHCHPTAEQVFEAVRHEVPSISLATVYKALEVLVEAGLAVKLRTHEGPARYDGRRDDHCHFRCLTTGQIYDVPVQLGAPGPAVLDDETLEALRRLGFHVTEMKVELVGHYQPK